MRRHILLTGTLLLLALGLHALPASITSRLQLLALYPVKAIASADPAASVESRASDAMEIQELRARIGELERQVDQLTTHRSRMEDPTELAPARVFLRGDLSSWRHTCYIDLGSKQGIEPGMAVADEHGLIGLVSAVFPEYSRVALLTDPSTRVRAGVQVDPTSADMGNGRLPGVLEADGSDRLRLRFIPADTPVAIGDPVSSSGLTGGLPGGIPIGKVESVRTENNGLTLEIVVKPVGRLRAVENVVVFLQRPARDLPGETRE